MLENKIRTPEELKKYMLDLKKWLAQERDKPIEEMADFFSNRIDNYDNVHLNNWAEEYAHIADYFDTSINSLLDIGCGTGLELASIYQKFPNVKITGDVFVHIDIPLRACLISQRVRIGEIGFLSCKAKSRSNPDGLQGFLTQSGRKICRQGGRGEMLNRLL